MLAMRLPYMVHMMAISMTAIAADEKTKIVVHGWSGAFHQNNWNTDLFQKLARPPAAR